MICKRRTDDKLHRDCNVSRHITYLHTLWEENTESVLLFSLFTTAHLLFIIFITCRQQNILGQTEFTVCHLLAEVNLHC